MRRWWLAAVCAATAWAEEAPASSALEFPDNGAAQFSRAGAWLATASDPIAAHYNPGAIVTQPTSFGIGTNFVLQQICFERRGPGDTELSPDATGLKYPETCTESGMNAIPNAAFVWRFDEKLAFGIAIVPPSSYGRVAWPASVRDRDRRITNRIAAPQRYLSLSTEGTILFPTLSAGYSITEQLHVGAGFVAGLALLEVHSVSMGNVQETDPTDNSVSDTRSMINARDLFVPGFVVGALYSASKNIDFAAWYRWMDKVRARGDLEVLAPYYGSNGEPFEDPSVTNADDVATITLTIPMEARIGARWHLPRPAPTGLLAERVRKDPYPTRDPLRDDLYDLELDLTWANNSAADEAEIRFDRTITVIGVPGVVPRNADRPTGWKDSFGARLGGQYNAVRNLAGVRLGSWIETPAVDDEDLTVTGVPALRGGFGGGFVLRVGAVDLEAGYQYIWNGGLDNDGDGKLRAIAGSGSPDNRSYHAVNGGSVTQHANVFSVGFVARP